MDDTTRLALAALHRAHVDGELSALEIDDHGVMHGENVSYIPTVRTQPLATPGTEGERHIEAIVWHYTDTRNAGAENLARRIAAKGDARSCHVWIDRRGHIAQSASFERGTWHAGSSTAALFTRNAGFGWEVLSAAQRGKIRGYGANSFAAGIELENVGALRYVPSKAHNDSLWVGWPFRFDHAEAPVIVPIDEVDPVRRLHRFTDDQARAALRVTGALARRYGLTRDACALTHHEIDPSRREDPGALWTEVHLPVILAAVFSGA